MEVLVNSNLNFLDNLLAVIVIYETDLNHSKTFTSLSTSLATENSVVNLLVYDNSSKPQLVTDTQPQWIIHYHHDPSNPGVSSAYNYAFKFAKQLNKQWLLLLDQDTEFAADAFQKYVAAANEQRRDDILYAPLLESVDMNGHQVIVSPCHYFAKLGRAISAENRPTSGLHTLKQILILSSGLLVPMSLFEKTGGYNEKIKMDFSDINFIDHYRRLQQVFYLIDTRSKHSLSSFEDGPDKSLRRFALFCESAVNSIETVSDVFTVFLAVLLKTGRMTLRFKTISFIRIFLSKFLTGYPNQIKHAKNN